MTENDQQQPAKPSTTPATKPALNPQTQPIRTLPVVPIHDREQLNEGVDSPSDNLSKDFDEYS